MTQLITNNDEVKEYHRKKLYELSIKSLGQIPQLDKPTGKERDWVNRRMRGSARTWESSIEHKPWIFRWQYFILEDYER